MINIYSDLERPGIDFDFMSLSFDWKVFLYWWWVVKLPNEVHVRCEAQPGQWWWMLVFLVLLWYFGKRCADMSYLEPRMCKNKLGFGAFLQNNIQKSFTLRVGPEIKLQCKQNKAKVSRAWFQSTKSSGQFTTNGVLNKHNINWRFQIAYEETNTKSKIKAVPSETKLLPWVYEWEKWTLGITSANIFPLVFTWKNVFWELQWKV